MLLKIIAVITFVALSVYAMPTPNPSTSVDVSPEDPAFESKFDRNGIPVDIAAFPKERIGNTLKGGIPTVKQRRTVVSENDVVVLNVSAPTTTTIKLSPTPTTKTTATTTTISEATPTETVLNLDDIKDWDAFEQEINKYVTDIDPVYIAVDGECEASGTCTGSSWIGDLTVGELVSTLKNLGANISIRIDI
jgi:hypothetical protein